MPGNLNESKTKVLLAGSGCVPRKYSMYLLVHLHLWLVPGNAEVIFDSLLNFQGVSRNMFHHISSSKVTLRKLQAQLCTHLCYLLILLNY